MRAGFRSTFRSIHVRNYRLFATGQLISLIFGWVQITAQDWLVLSLSHNSGTALGVVTALQFTPVLLLSLYAGKLADRLDKLRLLLLANTAWLILASLMGLLVVSGAIRLWQVLVFAGLWGCVTSMEAPIRQAFVSELVGADLLPNAMALNSATFNSARIVGPAVGGVIIATLGTGTAFLVNAVSYIGPLVALSLMSTAALHRDGIPGRAAADTKIVAGLRYVARRPDLLLPMALVLVVGMLGFNFQLTLALMARTVFHTNAASFGLLGTALAIGALVGALAGTARRSRPSAWLVASSALAFGVVEFTVGLAPTYLTVAALLVPAGFFMISFAQAANQRVQLGVDPAFRGRVMALYVMVFMGTMPVGAPLIGWFAEQFGPRSSIWLGGLGSVAVAAVALALLRRRSAYARPTPAADQATWHRVLVRPTSRATRTGVVPGWQARSHGTMWSARQLSPRLRPATHGGVGRSDRTGAQLSRLDR